MSGGVPTHPGAVWRVPTQARPASIPSRIAAGIVDSFVNIALMVLIAGLILIVLPLLGVRILAGMNGIILASLAWLVWGFLQWSWHARRGFTVGKYVAGIRTVSINTGQPAGYGPTATRYLLMTLASILTSGIGGFVIMITILSDRTGWNRGWHDSVGGVVLLEARSLLATRPTPAAAAPPRSAPAGPAVRTQQSAATPWPTGQASPPWPSVSAPVPSAIPQEQAPVPLSVAAVPDVPAASPTSLVSADTPAVRDPIGRPTPAERRGFTALPSEDELISAVPGMGGSPVAPQAEAAPAASAGDAPSTTLDPHEETIAGIPARGPFRLVFDHGAQIEVRGRGVVGRDPDAGSDSAAHVVAVPGDALSVSKTHVEFGLTGDVLWVRDVHSTNGVQVLTADGARALPVGEQHPVSAGTVVQFGQRSFEVCR